MNLEEVKEFQWLAKLHANRPSVIKFDKYVKRTVSTIRWYFDDEFSNNCWYTILFASLLLQEPINMFPYVENFNTNDVDYGDGDIRCRVISYNPKNRRMFIEIDQLAWYQDPDFEWDCGEYIAGVYNKVIEIPRDCEKYYEFAKIAISKFPEDSNESIMRILEDSLISTIEDAGKKDNE